MPQLTPTHQLPYPELSESPDVPRDLKALAEAVARELALTATKTELATKAGKDKWPGAIASGDVTATIPANGIGSTGTAVTYPVGLFNGVSTPTPVVSANTGTGGAWAAVGSVTATGFIAYLHARTTQTAAYTRPIHWIATGA